MSKETITYIREYIKQNVSSAVRQRARNISLVLKNREENDYAFSYKGTRKKPYAIHVLLDGKVISTTCDCPFDYEDSLCKHETAGLDFVIKDITNNSKVIKSPKQTKNSQKFNEIILKNHLLTLDLLNSLFKSTNYVDLDSYYSRLDLIKEGLVKTSYHNHPFVQQQYIYNTKTNVLDVSCECDESKNSYCRHVISGLAKLIKVYSPDFFTPNYFDLLKTNYLKDYGLTLKDDYEKYFSFETNSKGLQVDIKMTGLVSNLDLATQAVLPKISNEKQEELLVHYKANSVSNEKGIGCCFEYLDSTYNSNNLNYFNFKPFIAKYKKNTTDFTSSFSPIQIHSILDAMGNFEDKEKNILLESLKTKEEHSRFMDYKDLNNFKNSFLSLQSYLDLHKELPYFLKKESQNLVKKNLTPLTIANSNATLSFKFTEDDALYVLQPKIDIEGKSYPVNSTKLKIFPFFTIHNDFIYPFKTMHAFIYLQQFTIHSELRFFKKDYNQVHAQLINPISKYFEVASKVTKKQKSKIKEEKLKKQVYLSDHEGELVVFKLAVEYNNKTLFTHSKEQIYDPQTLTTIKRNENYENEFIEYFKELHEDFQQQEDVFHLTPFQLIENQWLIKASQKMEQQGITIFGAKDIKSFKYNLNKPTMTMGVSNGKDWFDLEIDFKYGNQKVSLRDIKKAVINKNKFVTLNDGTLGILPDDWLKKFTTYFRAGEVKNNTIKISNYQFNIIDELYENLENTPDFLKELQHKKEQLLNLKKVKDVKIPKTLKATLRPYQKEGVNWLAFLEENNLGGCLADDMGLGKTIQVIAFMAYLKSVKKSKSTHLVVAPTSLIFNWQNEIEKFCPSLKTLIYTGIKRKELLKSFDKVDLILTTYGSVMNDIDQLQKTRFDYIILDESQAIKNPNSKRYKAIRLLNSNNRLALTGTPIENNTFDLYAQINFLNPGLLGSMNHFKTEFSDAIDKEKNKDASILLSKMIHPFLLRRTKKQVATDLPEKTESIIYCEMGNEQRKVYEAYKNKYRDYLINKIDENGAAKSQMYVLEGLTKLRQICNSPELLNDSEDYGKASIKLDLLTENIKSKTAEHKVLVFSQFTSMLSLIKERLDNENIAYEYLDGKTRNREDKVANFQDTEELRVFLISLKAGGVGLNLTAADYVFLVDPWWNPAVENQAIDRSYRIGQTKKVMAYKLICKDTIEEKIIDLQKNKQDVSSSVIQVDTNKKSFDKKEIEALFS